MHKSSASQSKKQTKHLPPGKACNPGRGRGVESPELCNTAECGVEDEDSNDEKCLMVVRLSGGVVGVLGHEVWDGDKTAIGADADVEADGGRGVWGAGPDVAGSADGAGSAGRADGGRDAVDAAVGERGAGGGVDAGGWLVDVRISGGVVGVVGHEVWDGERGVGAANAGEEGDVEVVAAYEGTEVVDIGQRESPLGR